MQLAQRHWLLTALFLLIPPAAVALGFALMFSVALTETRDRLRDTAASQAALIEAMAKSERLRGDHASQAELRQAVLARLIDALQSFHGLEQTGEFTLGRQRNGQVVFTYRQGAADPFRPLPLPLQGNRGIPMQRATAGDSGVVTGPDYADTPVVAAYQHLAGLDMGLVAKIDRAELRAPFLEIGLWSGGLAALLGLFGAGIYLGSTGTLSRRLRQQVAEQGRILSHLPGMVYRCGNRPDWPMHFVSNGAEKLTGYRPEELGAGRPAYGDLIHPEDGQRVWTSVQQALEAGQRFQVSYRLVRADGAVRWVLDQGAGLTAPGGEAEVEGYITDITEAHESQRTRQRLSEILESSVLLVGMTDPEGNLLFMNGALRQALGIPRDADLSRYHFENFHTPAGSHQIQTEILPHALHQGPWHGELALLGRGGEEIPLAAVVLAHRDPQGQTEYLSLVGKDISDLKRTQEDLKRERDFSRALLAHLPGPFYLVAGDFTLRHWNARLAELTGYTPDELAGMPMLDMFPPEEHDHVRNRMSEVLRHGHASGEAHLLTREGKAIPHLFEGGVIELEGERYLLGFATDTTELHHQAAEIRRLAYRDAVTGLPNRTYLQKELASEISRSQRHGECGAVVYLDLDDFKVINDSLGHPAGDRLLAAFGRTVRGLLREEDTLARVGGDEFVAILPGLAPDHHGAAMGTQHALERVYGALRQPLALDGERQELMVSVTAGAALLPDAEAGSGPDTLLQQADTAMYEAKRCGKGDLRFYQPDMLASVRNRLTLEQDLRQALEEPGQLSLYFQPIVTDDSRRIHGVEALMRWTHPQRGPIPPGEFIPVAEQNGLIHRLGEWALDKALAQMAAWQEEGMQVAVSVNISPQQMVATDFVAHVIAALARHQIEGRQLTLEITEQALLESPELVASRMGELRAHGVRFSIDDFGTGYSSLVSLKQLPLDSLKVDKSFVRDLAENRQSQAITETILAMARQLELSTVAEGVETEDQADHLLGWGIDALQGFLYARPMPAEQATEFLRRRNRA